MNRYRYPILAIVALLGLHAAAQEPGAELAEPPQDGRSPDSLAAAVYSIVSGPAGQARDWDRYRALFVDGARLTTFEATADGLKVHTFGVEDYIRLYGPSFLERGVYEKEVWSRVDRYLHVAQRWGTCEYRWEQPDGPPAGRCQVTMQLVQDGERWWISSMVWEGEDGARPIAPGYLPASE